MNRGFWDKLAKPFFILAPMADVTDAAFRRVIAKHSKYGGHDIGDGSKGNLPAEAFRVGGPDVMYTEFVSCDGLQSEGRRRLLKDLLFTEAERPIVAQIFGAKPDNFFKTAELVRELGFDGIDINMGCPDRALMKSGSCAALIDKPALAQEIIRATQEGAGDLPVSVKTRIGTKTVTLETWLPALLETKPAAVTIHGRTAKEMSLVPAHWDLIARAAEIARGSGTLVVGNGDVKDLADARQKAQEYGVDGVMLGRAIFGNPFLFANLAHTRHDCQIEHPAEPSAEWDISVTLRQKLQILLEHAALFEELLGDVKNFAVMKKHFGAYVKGFDGAKDIRVEMMEAKTVEELTKLFSRHMFL